MLWNLMRLCVLAVLTTPVHAVDPNLEWRTLTSDNFEVHFASRHRQQAEHAIKIAENAHARLSPALNWQPSEKTHLVLSDETDFANGFATVININRSVLFMAPPSSVGGLEDFDHWLDLLITHEYVHVLHLDKVAGAPSVLRDIFGRWLLSFPNVFEPAWLVEGLATWYETDTMRGIGRGQSTLFESMMRAEVAAGLKPVSQVNLPITSWPSGSTRYLYGVYFFLFLEQAYGEQAIQRLIEAYSINLVPFSLNSTFKRVFGKDVQALWTEYTAWLEQRFRPQIIQMKQRGLVTGERFSASSYRSRQVRSAAGAIYYIREPGDEEEHIVRVTADGESKLLPTRNASFDVRGDGNIIISQLEICDEYGVYYDLYLFDASGKDVERLTECGRYQRVAWSADGERLYALKHEAGVFELQLLDGRGELLRRLHLFDEGDIPGDFDVAPDSSALVISMWRDDFGWNLYRMSTTDGSLIALTEDNHVQASPQYSVDGDHIYYSADYTDTYDIYRLPAAGGDHQQITRSLTGALQATMAGDTLYYTAYTAQGTHIESLQQPEPIAAIAPIAGERFQPYRYAPVETTESDYSPWPSMQPAWWFPTLVYTDDITRLGFTTAGNDALGIHNYFAGFSVDTENSVWHLDAVYSWSNRFSMALQRDNDLLKDAAGNKVRILRGDQLQLVYTFPDSGTQASSAWLLAAGLERIVVTEQFNGASSLGDFSDNFIAIAWVYSDAQRYPLSISFNDGRSIRLAAEDGGTLNSDLDGHVVTASWQEYISLGGEQVLALRALYGSSSGLTSRFQLGGENTGISYDLFLNQSGTALFGRRDFPLRGYADGLPQLRGRDAQLYTAEWRFPGQRTETGFMVPPVGLMQWYGTVFAETGAAYDGELDRFYSSIGFEFSADIVAGYFIPVTARIGVAHGLDDVIGETRGYLSVGASF